MDKLDPILQPITEPHNGTVSKDNESVADDDIIGLSMRTLINPTNSLLNGGTKGNHSVRNEISNLNNNKNHKRNHNK